MSSRGVGRGKSATNKAVEAAGREKKGCHTINRKRKVVQGGPSVAGYNEDDEWLGEGVATQEESVIQEEEEVSLKSRSFRRTSESIGIEQGDYEGGERRGGGGRVIVEDPIDVDAAVTLAALRKPSVKGIGTALLRSAQEALRPCTGPQRGGASHVGEGAGAGAASRGASHAGEGTREGAAVGVASHVGESARASDVAGVGEDDKALVNRVRQRNMRDGMEAASKLWVDDLRFWNETEGNAIVKLTQEARLHLVAVAQGVQPLPVRRSIVLPHTTIPQHKIEDETKLSAAKESLRVLKVQTITLRVIHAWVFKSASRQRGYQATYRYALNNVATEIARAFWMGEDWRICVRSMVFHTTQDMDMKLPLWFVGAEIEDRHEDDELASYQEASIQRLVGAFTSAVSMAKGVDDRQVSYERLKSIANTMRVMLATTMWLMRMSGDDLRAHYGAWLFVQMTAKPMLVASMHRSFNARRHILQVATVIMEKLVGPPMTLVDRPLYIPDFASCDVKFSHHASLPSPMDAMKLDWLGIGPPDEEEEEKADDEAGGGG
ncbi:hypothetical protein CBR_g6591 [Chara braunii]|uniref:Uncharacterized protein n=1 Tax=Chara braunii TaxID=69332 RepID=A0A388KKH1_CHABU|nr:hypothetical protein CBR_g6591 [Chara braunii]|eukprot:GBG70463.1 hypothetical protein CBR_g6591 [Chara braunii]